MNAKRFLILVSVLWATTSLLILISGKVLFPADFLGWYYPYKGYEPFRSQSPFLDNLGLQDVAICFYPYRAFVAQALSQGTFPWWNPIEGAGLPPGALHSNGSYFLPSWITYSLFTPLLAWQIDLSLQFFCASLGAYLLFERQSANPRAACLGALAWSLGGWHAAFFQEPPLAWPLALFPWVWLGLDDIHRGRKRGPWLVAGGICLSLFVGHVQMTFVPAILILGYLLLAQVERKPVMFLSCLSGVLLAAPHWLQLAQLASLSERGPLAREQVLTTLLAPREFLGLLFQNFMGAPSDGFYLGRTLSQMVVDSREHCLYAGVAVLLLALLAIIRLRDRATKTVVFLCTAGLLTASSTLVFSGLSALFPQLLILTPLRFLPFVLFGFCRLAVAGWDSLERTPLTRIELQLTGAFIGAYALWAASYILPATSGSPSLGNWLFALVQYDGVRKPPYFPGDFGPVFLDLVYTHFRFGSPAVWFPLLLLASLGLITTYVKNRERRFQLVAVVLCLDLLVYFSSMNIPVDKDFFYPETPEIRTLAENTKFTADGSKTPTRVLSLGRGIHPSMLTPYGISNFESYQSIFPADYRSLFTRMNGDSQVSYILAATTTPENLAPGLLDLFGISVLYNQPDPQQQQEGTSNLLILPREGALRAYLLNRYRVVSDSSDLFAPDFNPRREVLLDSPPPFESAKEPRFQEVTPTFYGYNEVRLRVVSETESLLILNDLHYPGWSATVNETPAPILKAYGFARAVAVPQGESEIVMRFRPSSLPLMLVLVGCGAFLLIALAIRSRRLAQPE